MSDESSNRPHSSDTTSTTKHGTHHLSETEFLAHQAEEAQRAIRATIARMEQTLKDSADLNAWTREYPWASVGVAALTGFVAAAALTPTGSSKQKKEWTAFLREALAEAESRESHAAAPAEAHQGSMFGNAVSGLLRTFGSALQSSVVAAATAKMQQPDAVPTNGYHEHATS